MPFPAHEYDALISLKGVGPTVVRRLEQIGFNSLGELAEACVGDIVSAVSAQLGSTCWKNSPQARAAIQAAIDLARSRK
ncbi:helix-hairpin-helix domain-containing protein [Ectopseudomonas khazarica]|uniref:helix-hairpin-helix domain-containing protein n=1 Tax=Ectopseudomonas khazarica TaxID=2502979 RepID=UPI000645D27E